MLERKKQFCLTIDVEPDVELIPGKSPYCASERDCQKMLVTLEKIFQIS